MQLTPKAVALKSADVDEAFATSGTIREDNNGNRSAEIDECEAIFGDQGVSYCAMGFWKCRFKAQAFLLALPVIDLAALKRMKTLHEQQFGSCSESCAQIVNDYTQRGQFFQVRPEGMRCTPASDRLTAFRAKVQRGDAVIYDWGKGEHHIEMFLRWEGSNMVLAAWNVAPDGDPHGKQGCYIKRRPVDANVWGCVRFNK